MCKIGHVNETLVKAISFNRQPTCEMALVKRDAHIPEIPDKVLDSYGQVANHINDA